MPKIEEFMSTVTEGGVNYVFGLDEEGHFYINGKRVLTEQKIRLDWWLNVVVALGAVGAFVQGIVALYSAL